MNKQISTTIILVLGAVNLLAGCRGRPSSEASLTPGRTATATIPVIPRATPYANQPAAGICAEPEGEIVEVYANPDMPDPRCVIVKPEQKLRVTNKTPVTIEVTLGTFTISLEPGVAGVMDQPFGEYLEPGVHQVMVSPCCGGEIWLKPD